MFKSNYTKMLEERVKQLEKNQKFFNDYENLLKMCQKNNNTFIDKYDYIIYASLVAIIQNYLSNGCLRTDIINDVSGLINIRPFVVDYDRNYGSSQN